MLDDILSSARARLGPVIASDAEWRAEAGAAAPARPFVDALTAPGLSVIAEVKRRSPSRGDLAPDLDPAGLARAYEAGGAAAISVLTEEDHFGGSLDDLAAVRAAVGVPVLRKDFVLHPAQVWQSRVAGADAVLLIAAVLDDAGLAACLRAADEAGIAALVEVHDDSEAARVAATGAPVIGVNNRDLHTFAVDPATAERLRPLLGTRVTVAESGVSGTAVAARMAAAGYDAILVGEAAVLADDPAAFVGELAGAA